MNPSLHIAFDALLSPAGLTENALDRVLGKMMGKTIDYADLYLQTTHQESWILEDGLVKQGSFHIDRGVGLRAISGEKTGFAYSDDLQLPALEQAAQAARSIARQGGKHAMLNHHAAVTRQFYRPLKIGRA